jgi:hypothetical protein
MFARKFEIFSVLFFFAILTLSKVAAEAPGEVSLNKNLKTNLKNLILTLEN